MMLGTTLIVAVAVAGVFVGATPPWKEPTTEFGNGPPVEPLCTVKGCNGMTAATGSLDQSTVEPLSELEADKRRVFLYWDNWANLVTNPEANLLDNIPHMIDNGVTDVILFVIKDLELTWDAVERWGWLTLEQRKTLLDYAHQNGARIWVSTSGATEHDPYSRFDPTTYGETVAKYVIDLNLDGLDFDMEGLSAGYSSNGTLDWIKKAHLAARAYLDSNGRPDVVIAHAPQGPYLSGQWDDGYFKFLQEHGDTIDHLFIQYYNQGSSYVSYSGVFEKDQTWFGGSAWKEMKDLLPEDKKHYANKLVVGKLVKTSDGGTGYWDPTKMAEYYCKAERELGYRSGLMAFQYHPSDSVTDSFLSKVGGDMCGTTSTGGGGSTGGPKKCYGVGEASWPQGCFDPHFCVELPGVTEAACTDEFSYWADSKASCYAELHDDYWLSYCA